MNQFQKGISFSNVDDFLEYITDHERKIVDRLRKIIFDCMPDCKEKLAYNTPFYYLNKRVLYIWPSSVPWGGIKEKDVVVLGFCKGQYITDETGYLNKNGRKEIATVKFRSFKDIDVDLLRSYIFEAIFLDEQGAKKKKSRS